MRTRLPDTTTRALYDREGQTVVYRRPDGQAVIGTLRRVPPLRWAAVAEVPRAEAGPQPRRPRHGAVGTDAALPVGIAPMVVGLGLVIVGPLQRPPPAAAEGA